MNVFADDQFTPTKWSTAEEKASFANDLLAFIMSGFPKTKFTQKLYQRLSNCFSHIAEYDRDNFYAVWFSSAEARHSFLRNLSNAPAWRSHLDVRRRRARRAAEGRRVGPRAEP